jgi:16S rRNA (guanine1516-N2)-methyltransferase
MIAVSFDGPVSYDRAKVLALQLNLPLVDSVKSGDNPEVKFLLLVTADRLQLQKTGCKVNPIFVDFLDHKLVQRASSSSSAPKQMLAKAVGVKKNYHPTVLDATAGLGKDAFLLAASGCEVHMLERSPIMGALLADGLCRLQKVVSAMGESDGVPRWLAKMFLRLTIVDAKHYIENALICGDARPDVIYLDPMYPERTKAALGKQAMRMVKSIVGEDGDSEELLLLALRYATKRVVVKRPRLAPSLSQRQGVSVDIVFGGCCCRYDVYTIHI